MYHDNARVITEILTEQNKRKTSKILTELSTRWAKVVLYVGQLHQARNNKEYVIRDLEINLLQFEAANEELRKENVDLHEQLEILTKDIHALEQRI